MWLATVKRLAKTDSPENLEQLWEGITVRRRSEARRRKPEKGRE